MKHKNHWSTRNSRLKLLSEMLQLDKRAADQLLAPEPRAEEDCVQTLQRVRTRGPLRFNGEPITIFPDYTATVAKAQAAFTKVRNLLRDWQGVWYAILFPVRFRVTYRGEDREFTDPDKALTYITKNIISSTEAAECMWDWSSQLNIIPLSTYGYVELEYITVPVVIRYKFITQCLHFLYTVPLSYW